MYGQVNAMSGEWTTGVLAAIWAKCNQRTNKFNTWVLCDGPVDAYWIENLNTVLDDNKILTLANGDRIPMTDNVRLLFENENLDNASPGTVSRTGIIYVSASDLGWWPPVQAWITRLGSANLRSALEQLFAKFVQASCGDIFVCRCVSNTAQVLDRSVTILRPLLCALLGTLELVPVMRQGTSFIFCAQTLAL